MLVGREGECLAIDQLVAGARIGEGGVLALTGEPGAGKTALLEYALAHLQGFRVLHAEGTEQEQGIGFAALLTLLRPALDLIGQIPAPQADVLATTLALKNQALRTQAGPGDRPGAPGDRFAIGAACVSLLSRYAEDAPVAVLVDDLHRLDRPSAEAVIFAARRLVADPVVVLLAARESECEDLLEGLPRLALTGLGEPESRLLAESRSEGLLTDDQFGRLYALTGGNPLALLELGSDTQVLDQAAPVAPPPVPASLAAAYTRQLRRLDPSTRTALLVASVADGDLRLTQSACELLDVPAEALGEAERAGLVGLSADRVALRHPLLRAAIHADAGLAARGRAHRTIAQLLPERDVDRRAWHLAEATWTPEAEVADLLARAAGHAERRSAYAVASTAYERAARLSPGEAEHVLRLTQAARTAWAGGLVQRAADLLDELDELAAETATDGRQSGDPRDVEPLHLRAALAARTGSLVQARDLLERAADLTVSPEQRVLVLADAVQASFYLIDAQTLGRLAQRLETAVADVALCSPSIRGIGLTAAGMAKVLTGQGGEDEIRSAIDLLGGGVELGGDPARVSWLMLAPLFLRDADSGAEQRALVEQVRGQVGIGVLPRVLFHVARDQATSRSWARAEANYAEAIRLARETGQSTELAMSSAGLACLESRQGSGERCRAHAEEALRICRDRQIHLGEVWVLFALGDLALSEGDAAAALAQLQQLEQRLAELEVADVDLSAGPELTDVLLRLGRSEDAARAAGEYLRQAVAKDRPWALARAHRAQGLVSEELDRHFVAALELHAHTLDAFETARTRLSYGIRLRRDGRRVDAREQLHLALEDLTELGAETWAGVCEVELAATGERVPRRAPTGLAALTTQELQVSLLLAEGRTTRETAAALFLSPKTVEYHLRKAYLKLGVNSRAALAELMPR